MATQSQMASSDWMRWGRVIGASPEGMADYSCTIKTAQLKNEAQLKN
jgi:hypothetical protein